MDNPKIRKRKGYDLDTRPTYYNHKAKLLPDLTHMIEGFNSKSTSMAEWEAWFLYYRENITVLNRKEHLVFRNFRQWCAENNKEHTWDSFLSIKPFEEKDYRLIGTGKWRDEVTIKVADYSNFYYLYHSPFPYSTGTPVKECGDITINLSYPVEVSICFEYNYLSSVFEDINVANKHINELKNKLIDIQELLDTKSELYKITGISPYSRKLYHKLDPERYRQGIWFFQHD